MSALHTEVSSSIARTLSTAVSNAQRGSPGNQVSADTTTAGLPADQVEDSHQQASKTCGSCAAASSESKYMMRLSAPESDTGTPSVTVPTPEQRLQTASLIVTVINMMGTHVASLASDVGTADELRAQLDVNSQRLVPHDIGDDQVLVLMAIAGPSGEEHTFAVNLSDITHDMNQGMSRDRALAAATQRILDAAAWSEVLQAEPEVGA